jgi:hypothetical protein
MKKITTVVMAAVALLAMADPAGASAQWQHNHVNLTQNAQVQLTGQFGLVSQEVGGVECQIDATMQLLAGTTTANVTNFGVDLTEAGSTVTSKCRVDSTTESFGCTDVAQVTVAGLPWTAHAVSTQTIAITTGTIQFHKHGGIFCPKTKQFTPGTIHVTTSTANTWTTGQLSGSLIAHHGVTAPSTANAHVTITPAGTYGVA